METINQAFLEGERALFHSDNLRIEDSVFDNGESPLKESSNLEIEGCLFRWKYPLWYCNHVSVKDSSWFDMARAGVWYSNHVKVEDAMIPAPKNFRRCQDLSLTNVTFTNAAETLWHCKDVKLTNVTAKGDYFALDCENMEIDGLRLDGNYSFDGVKNLTIRNSKLLSKDAFWNTENVTVYNSFISGEYLGWNARNLTLIDCTIESLQGLCYIDHLVMKNCKLINTNLAFEYSIVDAQVTGNCVSVLNPLEGRIEAEHIGELIVEPDKVTPGKTQIVCNSIDKVSDKVVY